MSHKALNTILIVMVVKHKVKQFVEEYDIKLIHENEMKSPSLTGGVIRHCDFLR